MFSKKGKSVILGLILGVILVKILCMLGLGLGLELELEYKLILQEKHLNIKIRYYEI